MSETRYVRCQIGDGPPRWARRVGSRLECLSAAPWDPRAAATETIEADRARLLAPVAPTKIVALGYNYRSLFEDASARTSKAEPHFTDASFEPIVFLKAPNSIANPGQLVAVPRDCEVWIEVELAAVIGKRSKDLTDEQARAAIFGVTIANDMTALNVFGRDWHLARSKSLDGFCPIGPELVCGFDDGDRAMRARIGERETQSSTTRDRVLDTARSVAFVSRLMTLEPGDVVMTGTPIGARQSLVRGGETVELEIDGLGTLRNTVVAKDLSCGT